MIFKVLSFELFLAEITLEINIGAVSFYMLSQPCSSRVQFSIAELAIEFVAVIVCHMIVKLINSQPLNLAALVTFMRKLALINEVTHIWINFSQSECTLWTALNLIGPWR